MKNLSWLNAVLLFLSCAGQCVEAGDTEPSNRFSSEKGGETGNEKLSADAVDASPLDLELLEFIAEFGDVDDEQFDIMLFHGKRDAEKEKRETQTKAVDNREKGEQ